MQNSTIDVYYICTYSTSIIEIVCIFLYAKRMINLKNGEYRALQYSNRAYLLKLWSAIICLTASAACITMQIIIYLEYHDQNYMFKGLSPTIFISIISVLSLCNIISQILGIYIIKQEHKKLNVQNACITLSWVLRCIIYVVWLFSAIYIRDVVKGIYIWAYIAVIAINILLCIIVAICKDNENYPVYSIANTRTSLNTSLLSISSKDSASNSKSYIKIKVNAFEILQSIIQYDVDVTYQEKIRKVKVDNKSIHKMHDKVSNKYNDVARLPSDTSIKEMGKYLANLCNSTVFKKEAFYLLKFNKEEVSVIQQSRNDTQYNEIFDEENNPAQYWDDVVKEIWNHHTYITINIKQITSTVSDSIPYRMTLQEKLNLEKTYQDLITFKNELSSRLKHVAIPYFPIKLTNQDSDMRPDRTLLSEQDEEQLNEFFLAIANDPDYYHKALISFFENIGLLRVLLNIGY